ncbi:hypothetical protein PR048_006476 [Dryococelus australis]|uniref:Uncharacterized protein n=1 Tax=Dryococelus australis TaxID=614101 RepID=A0ABQ9ICE2_9NEOP|nr:hypothetical protein PR048_006476 [Dryococelus australis]
MHTLEIKRRRRRRWWTKGWIAAGRGGAATFIDRELRNKYPDDFRNMLLMFEMHFDDLLERVRPHITKTDTNMRQAVNSKTEGGSNAELFSHRRLLQEFRDIVSSTKKHNQPIPS